MHSSKLGRDMRQHAELPDEVRFPECFNQTEINPRSRIRTRPMEVICLGMMRTGTMSIKAALEQLGYNEVYHMNSVMKNPTDAEMWREAFEAKYNGDGKPFTRADWDQLLGDCQACIDMPSAAFMPELIAAYPEAKVIISQRDPSRWYTSVHTTIIKERMRAHLTRMIAPFDTFFYRRYFPMMRSMIGGVFGPGGIDDPSRAMATYIELHDEVRAMVPRERRLEFRLGDGWGPLCAFLGKEEPKVEFPFVNEAENFKYRARMMRNQAYVRVGKAVLPRLLPLLMFLCLLVMLRQI